MPKCPSLRIQAAAPRCPSRGRPTIVKIAVLCDARLRDAATRTTRRRGSIVSGVEMPAGFRHEVAQWLGGIRETRKSSVS